MKIENEQKGGRSGEAAGRVWRPPVVGGSPRRSKLLSHFQLEMKEKLTTKLNYSMRWSDKCFVCKKIKPNQSEGGDENMCENFFGRKKINKNRTNIGFVQFQVVDYLLLGE